AIGGLVVPVVGLILVGSLLIGTGRGGPATPLGPPHFVQEAATAGVSQTYDGDSTAFVGGGVAVFDCNGDGKPDMYVAGGSNPAELYRNDSPVRGALRFTRLAEAATDLRNVSGAYPIDIDGDGHVDLALLQVGGVVLLRGLNDCRFGRANEALSFDGGSGWATAFSAKWERSAALPTIAVGNYLALDAAGAPTTDCAGNALIRPAADGKRYAPAIPLTPGYCTLSILFSDWDRSGRRDLRMTNDRHYYVDGEDQLWRVAAGEAPRLYTDADGWVSMQIWGMGIASYDLNGDGYPDVFLTSQGDNKLQTLTSGPGQPTYRDIALKRGVTATRPFTGDEVLPSTAWHPEFQDVNNDGFIDLFVSKGNVGHQPDYAQRDPSDLFLGQADGTFTEAADAAGIVSFDRGRGAALADFNLDGLLDLVEVNYGSPVELWRNVDGGDAAKPSPMGNWLALEIGQSGPNRDAIGAWVEVKVGGTTQRRELTIGGGHAGGQLGWIHFGLGAASDATVRVQWPDGETSPWLDAHANQFALVQRGARAIQPWLPPGG
ncbi:MAG TPA: CRTAC1 family protein, partial [Candidatus Limnocylindria bacterium]|nr:CRTAC1 family protein [Candidatus Limnocylindria bacterium]